jgi:hypothetical protein
LHTNILETEWEELLNNELLLIVQILTAVLLQGRAFWEFKVRFWVSPDVLG